MISDNRIKMICLTSLLLAMLLCAKVYGYEKRIVKQGDFEGKHWEIIFDMDKVGVSRNNEGVNVDGFSVFPCNNYRVDTVTIGKTLCFEIEPHKGSHCNLYNLKGESLLSFSFDQIYKRAGFYEFVKRDNVDTNYLCDSNIKLIKSDYTYSKIETLEGFTDKYLMLAYKTSDGYEHECYTMDMKMVLPRYKYLWIDKDNQGNFQYWRIEDCYGHVGRLDTNFNWIIPLEKRFSDIYDTTIAGVRYYRCKKDGYWGLYDTKFNEVIAPDFEDLSVFSGTNFIKFKLNGFWGVMTLQGRVTKTIIPTTRGYTNISRYIKSQKRFTYEMNGYKGECNHLGQQLSKIKVNTTATAPVSPKKEVTKVEEAPKKQEEKTIVVEHHRDPVPVQEWQQCQACFGSGQCPYVKCGGSGWYYVGDNVTTCSRCHGNGKCTICAGKGGHYITVYR